MIAQYRQVCYRCRRAQRVCLCGVIAAVQAAAKVVFLQHPKEARNVVGTARIAHLALCDSALCVGIDFSADAYVQTLYAAEAARSVVIYPSADAQPAAELARHAGPLTVWLIDGTWSQAKKLWRTNPFLHTLPAYRLAPTAPGNYRIRREPAPHCLATIEALAQVLDLVAGKAGAHQGLINAFNAMVERQLSFVHAGGGRKREHKPKPKRVLKVPATLDKERIVFVHAEGNGWPARSPDYKLLELRLFHPASGASHCLHVEDGCPPNAVALRECGMPAAGPRVNADAVRAALALYPNAQFVGWGHYAPVLLAPIAALPWYFDFKAALVEFEKMRLGYVDDAQLRLKLGSVLESTSRGERRMHALVEVARQYLLR